MNIEDKNKPLCVCHDSNMLWRNDKRHSKGGYWTCVIKHRENRRKRCKKYFQTEKGKKSIKRYTSSEKGKIVRNNYNKTEKGKARKIKYNNSIKSYITKRKYTLNRMHEKIINQLEELESGK